MVDHERDVGRVEPGVHRVQHRLRHGHAELGVEHGGHVGKHDGNGVVLANSELRKRRCETAGAGVKLRICEGLGAVHNRGVIREDQRGAGQEAQRRQRLMVGCIPVEVLRVGVRHYHHPNRFAVKDT